MSFCSSKPEGRLERAARTHHIADIAHHFLADGYSSPAPAPVWIVAGSGPWPWSAPAALELARLTGRESAGPVCLAEDERVPWSVRAHLAAEETGLLVVGAEDPAAHGSGPLCWHLGPVDSNSLDDLAAARRVPGCRLPGDGRDKVLVWCIGHGEVSREDHLLLLERLSGLLNPQRVEVLCVPENLRPGDRAGSRPAPSATVVLDLAGRAAEVCALPVAGHLLTGAMSIAARNAVLTSLQPCPVAAPAPFALDRARARP